MEFKRAHALVEKEFERFSLAQLRYRFPLVHQFAESKRLIKAMREAGAELKEKYGDGFVGIGVTGSRSKGYAKKGSDVDYNIFYVQRPGEARGSGCMKMAGVLDSVLIKPEHAFLPPLAMSNSGAKRLPLYGAWKAEDPSVVAHIFSSVPVFGKEAFLRHRLALLEEMCEAGARRYYSEVARIHNTVMMTGSPSPFFCRKVAARIIELALARKQKEEKDPTHGRDVSGALKEEETLAARVGLPDEETKALVRAFAEKVYALEQDKTTAFRMLPDLDEEINRQMKFLERLDQKKSFFQGEKHARFVKLYQRKKLLFLGKEALEISGKIRSGAKEKLEGKK